jgi:tripartite-type tricarboxylate transporter receptor subunit TctC
VLIDLLAGQVQAAFSPLSASLPYIRSGKLRALAVTSAKRLDALPDIPTVAEFVPGYEAAASDGIGAPKDTPADIVARLNSAINAGLADPAIKGTLADLGSVPAPMSSAGFGSYIAAETEKWAKVIKFANIKAE